MAACEIELTFNEVTLLCDAITLETAGPEGEGAYPDLMLKIGSAFIDSGPDKPRVKVMLTREELWMIREICKTPMTVGPEKVGLNLLRKIYPALRELHADEEVHGAVARIGEGSYDEPQKGEKADKIEEWNKK